MLLSLKAITPDRHRRRSNYCWRSTFLFRQTKRQACIHGVNWWSQEVIGLVLGRENPKPKMGGMAWHRRGTELQTQESYKLKELNCRKMNQTNREQLYTENFLNWFRRKMKALETTKSKAVIKKDETNWNYEKFQENRKEVKWSIIKAKKDSWTANQKIIWHIK